MIPEAAVEAAMAQLERAKDIGYSPWWTVQNILEAAAPHMLRDAKATSWDEGAKATDEYERQYRVDFDFGDDLPEPPVNPYRGEERKTTILRLFEPGSKWEEL